MDPRAVRKHYDPMDLVTLAQQVQKADEFVQATTSNKLKIIVDQIKYLQGQVCTYTKECRQQCSVGKLIECKFLVKSGNLCFYFVNSNYSGYISWFKM